ncbi:type I secretion system permease/ATPase [Maritimibacter sp. DP1N21-5]|uniref:type I secretion system permease/ATPase n=1 Tax=Maritimibacter sp. DP1N21-5 TaxID=2836867 RepID=UPI001C46305D|nr:type I secretion system permease/ATPase [Maritimibacter sp. DP1N21-5]MBV7407668.1 type I secretion system permease/ATPase [Maritimibacter sp. DP1N21-5]
MADRNEDNADGVDAGAGENAHNPRLILGASEDARQIEDDVAGDRSTAPEPARGEGQGDTPKGPVAPNNAPPALVNGSSSPSFHKRTKAADPAQVLSAVKRRITSNLLYVIVLTMATNVLILAVPLYLFQISDRVLTSRSIDTLVMLTVVIAGAIVLQAALDAVRRFVLMRTAVDVAARLGAPVLAAAAQASLHSNGREYQTLGDLQTLRGFLVSGTLLSFLDVPFVPAFIFVIFLIHPHLGMIVIVTALLLAVMAFINQKITSQGFKDANVAQVKANLHLESMSRNSQIINAMAMIPEAVRIWGADTAASLKSQVKAQDRNIVTAAMSRMFRLLAQIAMLGWGAWLALDGQMTGGMVIAASIVAGRALAPIEGSIEGWNSYLLARGAYDRVGNLMSRAARNNDKLRLPNPEGRLDVERLLFVPAGTKSVVLNALTFSIGAGERLAIIGNSGAGKTTLGKMLVGSILPTSGAVRLDLMDLRNWDPRQLGECVGYLPQDVQLFPGTIKANIARMRSDASDEAIYRAAMLADVHDMIADLPQGYETVVAADGAPLSGGQKQRIGLARAFFGDPKFLVLDEPNSNLDTHGDAALVRALGHAKEHKITTIVISQKPNILTSVDKIMVLDTGHISMFGWRDKILKELANRRAARQQNVGQQSNTSLEGAPA